MITLRFTNNVATGDGNTNTPELRIHTLDTIAPAAARIEVSANGTQWVDLNPPAINDSRTLFWDDNPSGYLDLDIDASGLSSVEWVRITDQPISVDGDVAGNPPGSLGFDLDAIESITSSPVPTMSQWGLIMLALVLLCAGAVAIWKSKRYAAQA